MAREHTGVLFIPHIIRYALFVLFRFFLLLTIFVEQDARADDLKDKIEAAFLYNFLKYITWPSSSLPSDASVTICIYNSNSLENALHYVQQQKASERRLIIIALQSSDKPTECHIVFISSEGPFPLYFTETAATAKGMLLVSDIPGFIQKGGMIGLVEEEEHLVLEINNTALTRAGLKASSRLLNIARRVI